MMLLGLADGRTTFKGCNMYYVYIVLGGIRVSYVSMKSN